ncbi:MAG: dTMP kinase [Candidatus Marinimicrobia bacterium]|nr:dTMP kinase [Candidatus Neomarinimicrobiota bacterium]
MKIKKSLFISFEGLDGSGKSTQVTLLETYLLDKGYSPLILRDPGSTAIGELIRNILLDKANMQMNHVTELLLYAAARSQMVSEKILPALEEGKIVISDRFFDSTTAYQGYGRQLPKELIDHLNSIGSHKLDPDLSIFLDLDITIGLERLDKSRARDRMETEDLQFKQRVRKAFLDLAQKEPLRFITVDAEKDPQQVHQTICKIVQERLNKF